MRRLFNTRYTSPPGWIFPLLACALLQGCAGAPPSAESEQFFPTPGRYSAAPLNAAHPRVGVPPPAVEVVSGAAPDARTDLDAADQLFWIADQSGRFNLIERLRIAQIIGEQGLTGMIHPGDLVRPGRLPGVDYLLICRISALSIRGADKPATVSVANVERVLHVSAPVPRITTTCQIDMRLIDPATGAAGATAEDSFRRVCSPEALGLAFATPDAAWGDLHLNDDQLNIVLRVVLDDALRLFLPQVDALLTRPTSPIPAPPVPVSPVPAPVVAGAGASAADSAHGSPNTQPAVAKIHCPECGFECSPDDEFCPNCGNRLLLNGVRVKPAGK